MRFHSVHGANIVVDEGGTRAIRITSFCEGVAFSSKPLPINSRVSVLLGVCEEWTGAIRLGLTSQDPGSLSQSSLPRYACPDLTCKQGFWARPLPEKWATHGTRLTFYVNSLGHFQLFVNNEHKGALLSGLPVKEQLWVMIDLYGTTVSVKFVSTTGSAPVEVVARGPEALFAYQQACTDGSISCYRTRLSLIGPPGSGKTTLKMALMNFTGTDTYKDQVPGIDTTCTCQTVSVGGPWRVLPSSDCLLKEENDHRIELDNNSEEEYFYAIAVNVVRELMLQKKKRQEEKKKTPLVRSAFRLQSSFTKIAPATRGFGKGDNEAIQWFSNSHSEKRVDDYPMDLPERVVELVETMLKEAESKQDWDKQETEKTTATSETVTFSMWDFTGESKYFILHQLFLSPQAIYLLTFDLTRELDAPLLLQDEYCGVEFQRSEELSTLCFIHLWLSVIHAVVSHSVENEDEECSFEQFLKPALYPTVVIVGTHRDLLDPDPEVRDSMIELQFNKIKESLQKKPYAQHLYTTFFAVGLEWTDDDSAPIADLRKQLENIAIQQPHVGIEIPLKWLAFERAVERLLDREVYLADINKLSEVARLEDIQSEEEFRSMIHFYHHQGKVWHLGSDVLEEKEEEWSGAVVLKPQWFIDYIYQVVGTYGRMKLNPPHQDEKEVEEEKKEVDDKDNKEELGEDDILDGMNVEDWDNKPEPEPQPEKETVDERQESPTGIIPAEFFDKIWPDAFHHKVALLGILDSADISSEVDSAKISTDLQSIPEKSCFVPWLSEHEPDPPISPETLAKCLTMIMDFSSLPVGLFSRLLSRVCRWSEQHNWKKYPRVNRREGRIAVDYDHDLILKRAPLAYSRIQVFVVRRRSNDSEDGPEFSPPSPHVCGKVRHLLETELETLRDSWYKRISFILCVPCPCDKVCEIHSVARCPEDSCLHLLPLNECLSKKVVECDYRRVKTNFVQKHFIDTSTDDYEGILQSVSAEAGGHSSTYRWDADYPLMASGEVKSCWDAHDIAREEPQWLKGAAKMLISGVTGRDWIALAKRLGYSEREITRFEDELQPSIALLHDWLESNGRTRYSIDLLTSSLEQMGRQDVAERIQTDLGPEMPAPPVFVSYQWDNQEAVLNLRKRLELAGFPCWMDVGQLGGGDTLYGRIYEGISRAKVVLCCLTPRYALSPTCSREASLADVLRKPIVPVMLEPTPWPPPGALAVVLSSLVYVDLCGIGGHGGSGRQADWESRFQEIVERLSHYITPAFSAHQMSPHSAVRMILPSTGSRRLDDFSTRSLHPDERDAHGETGLPDEETSSMASNLRGRRTATPMAWEQPQVVNRVVRCSVCSIL